MKVIRLVKFTMLIIACYGCRGHASSPTSHDCNQNWEEREVEVAPGEFITIRRRDKTVDDPQATPAPDPLPNAREWTELEIPWNNEGIKWSGIEIPLSLRKRDASLFMIVFDRETDRGKPRFCYYKSDGQHMVPIDRGKYPKDIAIQNMWFSEDRDLESTRRLDPTDSNFLHTYTATAWEHLETGKDYYETGGLANKDVVREYLRKYKPARLLTIRKPLQKK